MQSVLPKTRRFRFRIRWIDIAGLMTILSITGFTFFSFPPQDQRRWVALGLLVVFTLVQLLDIQPAKTGRQHRASHLILAFLVVINMGLFWSNANPLSVVILFFVLSVHAMETLPTRLAFSWIGLFGLCTISMLATVMQPAFIGMLNGMGALGGYCFLGLAANAQRRAEQAHEESQRLLNELQVAHRQLREQANQAEELAISRERNRLARDVHDTLGHRLTVAAVQLEGAQRLISRDPDKATDMVSTVRQQVMDGLNELRQTVAALRAPLEHERPLSQALTGLVQQFEQATGLTLHLDLPDPLLHLSRDYRQALYRTIQEALTNIQKHAQAHVVSVRVEQRVNADGHPVLLVAVEDDGIGLPGDTGL
ncbi:MAG: histidine kinase, partial [Candidatus Tectomicrobia bacterium]|nr:histidine kinase [Candidatus Tectomicrobia bacterium]